MRMNLISQSLKWTDEGLFILDQRALPDEQRWMPIRSPREIIYAIQELAIRGAPLIGVGAALALYAYAEDGASPEEIRTAAEQIRAARPTAVNLMHAIDRMVHNQTADKLTAAALRETALEIYHEDVELCRRMAQNGLPYMPESGGVLTHCNTGGLATVGIGTALGVISHAYQKGRKFHVFVDETRPLLQGARLTAWELQQAGIPSTLICDNMAGALMRAGRIQCVILGADRIAMNGDFANKTGTYSVAVLAHYHNIPFYVAAPVTTLDGECPDGSKIPVEERLPAEVRGIAFAKGQEVRWSPPEMPVYNPAFDVTPADLVTAYILDTGSYSQADVKAGRLVEAFAGMRGKVNRTVSGPA